MASNLSDIIEATNYSTAPTISSTRMYIIKETCYKKIKTKQQRLILIFFVADNGRNLSNMKATDHLQSNLEIVPTAQFRILKDETFIIQKPIKLQTTMSIQKSSIADIQKILRCNATKDSSLSLLTDAIHPTWIIRRHFTQNNNKQPESKFEISTPVKIDNWTAANAKRVEANRKLLQQQIPYKSPTASATFRETIEEYERIIGMHQQQHQNVASNGENTRKHGTSSNGTSYNKASEKSMEMIEEQYENEKLKKTVKYKGGKNIEQTAPISESQDKYDDDDDHIQNKTTINKQTEPDSHQSYTIKKEREDMPRETYYQATIVRNVFEGKPTLISSSNSTETLSSNTEYSLTNNDDNVKRQICDIKVNKNTQIIDPSTTTLSYDKLSNDNGQISRRMARSKYDRQKRCIINGNEKDNSVNNVTSKLPFHSQQSTPLKIAANVTLNTKQTPIRTLLSRKNKNEKEEMKDEEKEDEYDLSEGEHQPDWVTSSFRLGSIRRKKNEKNMAMQRIQKEIELEKERYREMIKMRRNNKITLF
ncbi:unnamed protein product [Cercopithifilaria johnstoni]|uniref:Uncharacterized protein n=1 Tax=Cercopithifilaria johnstoni TaxID=2874296 RepID=A0A8J2MNP2_9BILA|nr:unnamed protein product [Cercopithifilaria johnstoni]